MLMETGTTLDHLLGGITGHLQLKPEQHRDAESWYATLSEWLALDPEISRYAPEFFPQGSLSLGTTVRPKGRKEFDLDFVVQLRIDFRRVARPSQLLELIERRLRAHPVVGAFVSRENRCVRVRIVGKFHLDVVPACPDVTSGGNCIVVPDLKAEGWKPSNPRDYRPWFTYRCAILVKALEAREPLPPQEEHGEKAPLKLAVQLLKRWRDVSFDDPQLKNLAPASCVLTTVAAASYRGDASVASSVAVAIDGLILATSHPVPRPILNPVNAKELLNEQWMEDRTAYEVFGRKIRMFGEEWAALGKGRGLPQIGLLLGRLFGEDAAEAALGEMSSAMEKARRASAVGVVSGSGFLTTAASPVVTPVRSNNFYGAD